MGTWEAEFDGILFVELDLQLKIFSGHQSVKVSYFDDDDDLVVIGSEEELQESFNVSAARILFVVVVSV